MTFLSGVVLRYGQFLERMESQNFTAPEQYSGFRKTKVIGFSLWHVALIGFRKVQKVGGHAFQKDKFLEFSLVLYVDEIQ